MNGVKKPLCILIDTGIISSIILKKCIDNKLIVKKSRNTTEWTTLGGKFFTKKQGTAKLKRTGFS
jgi:predicted aspartyl protease